MIQARLFVFLAVCVAVLFLVSDVNAQGLRWERTNQDESNGIMDAKEYPEQRSLSGNYWDNIFPHRALKKRSLAKNDAGIGEHKAARPLRGIVNGLVRNMAIGSGVLSRDWVSRAGIGDHKAARPLKGFIDDFRIYNYALNYKDKISALGKQWELLPKQKQN